MSTNCKTASKSASRAFREIHRSRRQALCVRGKAAGVTGGHVSVPPVAGMAYSRVWKGMDRSR